MQEFGILFILAILVEAIWEILGNIYKDGKIDFNLIATLAIGIGLVFVTEVNFLELLKINSNNHTVGLLISGVIISRGSNFLHDLVTKLEGGKDNE